MAALRTRLSRLEKLLPDRAADKRHHLELIRMTSAAVLCGRQGLELVAPEDTDKETYAAIERLRLNASGRHDEADEVRAKYAKPELKPPPEVHQTPAGYAAWLTRQAARGAADRGRREDAAIAAATARLARKRRAG
jgi:hypothetical protein